MNPATQKLIRREAHDFAERLSARLIAALDVKPAPGPVDLGEWRGFKLTFHADRCEAVHAWNPDPNEASRLADEPNAGWWKPEWKASISPLLTNALLTAYRRAVERRLTTWPEGWEWAAVEIPHDWPAQTDVFLGIFRKGLDKIEACCFPFVGDGDTCPESRRRAALLGLCAAKPAVDPAELARIQANVKRHVAEAIAQTAEAKLREAGASVVTTVKGLCAVDTPRAFLQDNRVWLCMDALTLPRACAALRAAQGLKYQDAIDELREANEMIEKLEADVDEGDKCDAVKDAEIARLKRGIGQGIAGLEAHDSMSPQSFAIWSKAWCNTFRNRRPQ